MTDTKKPLEIEFAPGAFDHFDGTQEELDQMMAEIMDMFSNMSPEELEAASKPVDWDNLSEEEIEILKQTLNNEPRTLQ
jgi:hypothetical protein